MEWRLLPHVVALFLTSAFCLALAIVLWRRRRVRGAWLLLGAVLAIAEWTFAAAVEAAVTDAGQKVLWSQIEYPGMLSAVPLVFLFVLRYENRWHLVTPTRSIILWLVPMLSTALAWTNDLHGLVWPYVVRGDEALNVLVYGHGPAFWVVVVYSYVVVGLIAALLIRSILRHRSLFRAQRVAMLVACLSPAVAGLAYYADLTPVHGLDWTPIGGAVMVAILSWNLFGLRFLKLVPVARETLVEQLQDGVIVLDLRGRVLDANPAARQMLDAPDDFIGRSWRRFGHLGSIERFAGLIATSARGERVSDLVFHPGSQTRQHVEEGDAEPGVAVDGGAVLEREGTERHLEVRVSSLFERKSFVGWLVTLRDVTRQRRDALLLASLTQGLEDLVEQRTRELNRTILRLQEEVTERRRAEQMLREMEESLARRVAEQSRKLSAIHEVMVLAGETHDQADMQARALRLALAVVGADAGCLHLSQPDGSLRLAVSTGLSGSAVRALATVPPLWLRWQDPAVSDEPLDPTAPVDGLAGFAVSRRAAIHLRGRVIGALSVFWLAPREFAPDDAALFDALSDQVGIVLESVRLHQLGEQEAIRRERRRLARDLHDSVTQSLHSLVLEADTAANRLRQGRFDRLGSSLAGLSTKAQQALREMRLLLFELRLAPLEDLNLVEALQTRLKTVEERAGIEVSFRVPALPTWPKSVEPDLYCIAMEALNNALKHARHHRVDVGLESGAGWLTLEISDDGQGFPGGEPRRGGFGLLSMAERAERLGGRIDIDSSEGGGTRIRVRIEEPKADLQEVGRCFADESSWQTITR